MSNQKVRWGIVGPGVIAHEFADDFAHVTNAQVVAVASRSKARAQQFAQKYGIAKVYHSYDALFADAEVDAVYVATPHTHHLVQSTQALQSGKAVLCEKPITTNPSELQQLLQVANSTGNYLIEGMWTYFLPVFAKVQQWINEGRLGTICHVKADFGYPKPYNPNERIYDPNLAGGCLLEMGIYTIAMAWLVYRKDPSQMHVIAQHAPNGVEVDVSMQFGYKQNGQQAMAQLATAFRCKLNNWTYIIGDKGYVAIPDFWRARECFFFEEERIVEHYQDNRKGHGFEYEIEAVSRDILEGRTQSALVPHSYSLKFQEHMHQVKLNMKH